MQWQVKVKRFENFHIFYFLIINLSSLQMKFLHKFVQSLFKNEDPISCIAMAVKSYYWRWDYYQVNKWNELHSPNPFLRRLHSEAMAINSVAKVKWKGCKRALTTYLAKVFWMSKLCGWKLKLVHNSLSYYAGHPVYPCLLYE